MVRHYCLSIHRKEALCDHTLGKARSMTKCRSSGDWLQKGESYGYEGGTCFASLVLLLFLFGEELETGNGGVPMGRLLKHGN